MKKSELKQIIREEIRKVVNEFGPGYASQNTRGTSSNPLVKQLGELDKMLMNTTNSKAYMDWDDYSSNLLGSNDAKYWADLDDQDLQDAINTAQSIVKKYNIHK